MEQFKEITGWPGYFISDQGRMIGRKGHEMKPSRDKDGYLLVSLATRKPWGTALKLHRVVVSAFIGPIPEGMQVNHKNGIKHDNRLENLEVVTPQQNTVHAWKVLGRTASKHERLKGSLHPHARLCEDDVRKIRALYASGLTQVEIAKQFGLYQSNVSAIVLRKAWAHVQDYEDATAAK